jgi:hypothetical protein
MSLAYPIAQTLEDAARPGVKFARSRREAAELSPGLAVVGLETGWLHLTEAEALALFGAQGADGPAGHLQRYEDTSGHVVVAISWWKVADPKAAPSQLPPPAIPAATARDKSDHTDDLYFRRGRTKSKRRKPVDPNQLDLFGPQKS